MFIKEQSRRDRRQYRNFYKKISHQRGYIAQTGRWLGYTFEKMKDHFIYPGLNDKSFSTCKVKYRSGRWWIDEIPYTWRTKDLVKELIRLRGIIDDCPDIAYRTEAKKWLRKKVFEARVLHYRTNVKISLLKLLKHK